jgi:hypothetical protein
MKYIRHILLIPAVATALWSCNRGSDPEEHRLSWSTESVMSIPYRLRQQRFERGNLLRNPSFENGKTLKVDSVRTSSVIEGWHQAGTHVAWVDITQDSLYAQDEAYSGHRSVRVIRTRADETEKLGEGVLSEFVKVIPGNYALSFYARMKDVKPVKGRLGMRMVDAVNVQLQFYDKNKIALDPAREFPQLHRSIDNSFKALSLANFTEIPEFRWGRIIGKSAAYPFFDGDIPTDAHYVKIFIGLKGTGTLWIDSVSLIYTRKNFSVAERMMPYTDSTFQSPPAVIPRPKRLERLESVTFATGGKPADIPLILVPPGADPLVRKAADMLQTALSAHARKQSPEHAVRILDQPPALLPRLTFVLGQQPAYAALQAKMPISEICNHPQGYYLWTLPEKQGLVFLSGNNPLGTYYAVMTAIQLIDRRMPVFHNARVVDYPDFENRFITIGLGERNAIRPEPDPDIMAVYKINGAFAREQVVDRHIGSGLFSIVTLPAWPAEPEDSTLDYPWPVRRSPDPVTVTVPGLFNLVIPPLFHNQLLDYAQADQVAISLPGNAVCLYAGSDWFSRNTDAADIARFTNGLTTRPAFMDNSMQAATPRGLYGGAMPYFPGKLRLFNLFEPFGNSGIREFYDRLDPRLYWVNFEARSEISLIRLCTAADFMWNSRDYDPDQSLWYVLVSRYGADAARELVYFADRYSLLLEIQLKLQRKETLPQNLKNIQADMDALDASLSRLTALLGPGHAQSLQLIRPSNLLIPELLKLSTRLKESLNTYLKPAT